MADLVESITKGWRKKPGASQEIIDDVQQLAGFELPADLLDFIRKSNGAAGHVGDESAGIFMRIDPIEEWVPATRDLDMERNKVLVFASDGGEGVYAVSLKTSPMQFLELSHEGGRGTYLGDSLADLFQHLKSGTRPEKPKKSTAKPKPFAGLPQDKPVRELKGHKDIAWGTAVSPDNTRVATTCPDGKGRIFDLKTGKLLQECGPQLDRERPLPMVRWIDNDQALICMANGHEKRPDGSYDWFYRFVEIPSGREVGRLVSSRSPHIELDGAFSPDGTKAMVVIDFADKCFVEIATGSKVANLPSSSSRGFAVDWRRDGRLIALGRRSNITPFGWDTSSAMPPQPDGHLLLLRSDGSEIGWIKGDVPVLKCEFDAGHRLLVVRKTDVLIYDLSALALPGEPIARFTANLRTISSGCFVGADRIAITTAEGNIYIYDIATGAVVEKLLSMKNQHGVVSATSDGKLLLTSNAYTGLSSGMSKTVRVWNVAD